MKKQKIILQKSKIISLAAGIMEGFQGACGIDDTDLNLNAGMLNIHSCII